MRYLIFHKDHPLNVRGVNSGAENATLWLARALAKSGCSVVVCGQLTGKEFSEHGVSYWDLGENFDIASALVRAREGEPYHLIAACRALPIVLSQTESNCISRSFIAHDPTSGATGIKPEILSRIADRMICVSEAQRGLFIQGGADPRKVVVVPNGADLELFQSGDVTKRNYKRFIFVGALVAHKGIDILLNAFVRVLHKHPTAMLDVYGSAGLWGEKAFLNEAEISAKVPQIRFHGAVPQSQVAQAFREAGACIMPSRWFDSFPLTAVEAQVSGCPVIGFDVGGIREAVQNGRTGLLLEEVSEDGLNKVMEGALDDPTTLKVMSQNALNDARKIFTWENTANRVRALCEKGDSIEAKALDTRAIGVVTTWNQECGLAQYARNMLEHYPTGSYVVFGETTQTTTQEDEPFVFRCWDRASPEYSELEREIKDKNIGVLLLNCQSRFFAYPNFSLTLKKIRSEGVKVVAIVHNVFTITPHFQELSKNVDSILVHSQESRLEAIANGAPANAVEFLPLGVKVSKRVSELEKNAIRTSLALPLNEKIITSFGFVQPHKGLEGLIEAVAHLNQKGISTTGIVAGTTHSEDLNGQHYQQQLKEVCVKLGLGNKVIFLNRFITEEEVNKYLSSTDIALFNYHSQHYEASASCAQAVGMGIPVVTSVAPPFQVFKDAVFHATSGFPPALASEVILTNSAVAEELTKKALEYADANSWARIKVRLFDLYRRLGSCPSKEAFKPMTQKKDKEFVVNQTSNSQKKLRVLLHNRPTTFTHKGGDTIVVEKLLSGIAKLPVDVVVDLEAKEDPSNFDVVHIVNFALPEMVKFYGERAKAAGKPFVVTTLMEDVPLFHNQSHYVAASVMEYISKDQSAQWWNENKPDTSKIPASGRFENEWSARNAAALLTNGAGESRAVTREYGSQVKINEVKLGYEVGSQGDAARFEREFGVKDFVLCVGRIESRKNQLMLLKALENEDLTVVFAGGGFTYQPEYEQAARQFKRKGRTIFLPRLTNQQLADAYAAAKVHALPSWYELPGLVSLEAAFYGCNIVATKRGSTYDYLGDDAFYCNPDDEDSIRSAVIAAYYSPFKKDLKERVMKYSWEEMAKKTFDVYKEVSGWKGAEVTVQSPVTEATTTPATSPEVEALITKGEELARETKYDEAISTFAQARKINPRSARCERATGAVLLAQGKWKEARPYFMSSSVLEPKDSRTLCGIGMCAMLEGQKEEAYDYFSRSLEIKADHNVALLQLIECSYALNRFDALERALRSYLVAQPADSGMEFCLAGCLYKMGRYDEARAVNGQVLAKKPGDESALELAKIIDEASKQTISRSVEVIRAEPSVAQPRSDLSSSMATFNDVDSKLIELEDAKRKGNFEDLRKGLANILDNSTISQSQRETARCLWAEMNVLLDNVSEAEATYNDILTHNRQCARAICGRGALAASRSDWWGARRFFEEALSYRPEYDVALSGLGLCAAHDKNYEDAWTMYSRSLSSNSENMRALLGLIETGYVLKRLPDVEGAIQNYLDAHPADIDMIYSLAGCCFAQGKIEQATSALQTLSLFAPNHKNALELRAMIERGTGFQPTA